MIDDYLGEMLARKRRRRRSAVRVAAVALVASLFVWGPDFALERAAKAFDACSSADEDAPNPKTDCSGGKAWLLFPKIVPWKHAAAMKASRSMDFRVALRKLKLATKGAPSAERRDEAVAGLTDVFEAAPRDELPADALASALTLSGAQLRSNRARDALDSAAAQRDYLLLSEQYGRLDDAIAFAKTATPPKTEDFAARDLALMRGALLCLTGDETAGRALLHDAIRVHAKLLTFPFFDARIALAACGEITQPSADDQDRDALRSYQIGTTLTGAVLEQMCVGAYDSRTTIRDGYESPFVAAAILSRDHTLEETLQLVAVLSEEPTVGLSPWAWQNDVSGVYPVLVEPARDEAAAERLEALAAAATPTQKALTTEEELEVRLPVFASKRYAKIHQTPAASLRAAARGYWLEAAGNRARAGQCDRAAADAKRLHSEKESAVERVYLASLLVECGLYDDAADVAADDTGASTLRAVLLMDTRVQTLAHAGRYAEARDLAKQALARTSTLEVPTSDIGALLDDNADVIAATSYLVLALSLRTNDSAAAPAVFAPTPRDGVALTWNDLIARPETERMKLRWNLHELAGPTHSGARPAEMFVVGKAVETGVEVWLDAEVSVLFQPSKSGRTNMRARAEAARWRGDTQAETAWIARAAAVEKLVVDPRKVVLARTAGL